MFISKNKNNLPLDGQHVIFFDSLNQETVAGYFILTLDTKEPFFVRESTSSLIPVTQVTGWISFPSLDPRDRRRI